MWKVLKRDPRAGSTSHVVCFQLRIPVITYKSMCSCFVCVYSLYCFPSNMSSLRKYQNVTIKQYIIFSLSGRCKDSIILVSHSYSGSVDLKETSGVPRGNLCFYLLSTWEQSLITTFFYCRRLSQSGIGGASSACPHVAHSVIRESRLQLKLFRDRHKML